MSLRSAWMRTITAAWTVWTVFDTDLCDVGRHSSTLFLCKKNPGKLQPHFSKYSSSSETSSRRPLAVQLYTLFIVPPEAVKPGLT